MVKTIQTTTNKIYLVGSIVVLMAVGAALLVDAATEFQLAQEVLGLLGAALFVGGLAKLVQSV